MSKRPVGNVWMQTNDLRFERRWFFFRVLQQKWVNRCTEAVMWIDV